MYLSSVSQALDPAMGASVAVADAAIWTALTDTSVAVGRGRRVATTVGDVLAGRTLADVAASGRWTRRGASRIAARTTQASASALGNEYVIVLAPIEIHNAGREPGAGGPAVRDSTCERAADARPDSLPPAPEGDHVADI
jgi:hypothetical protein